MNELLNHLTLDSLWALTIECKDFKVYMTVEIAGIAAEHDGGISIFGFRSEEIYIPSDANIIAYEDGSYDIRLNENNIRIMLTEISTDD